MNFSESDILNTRNESFHLRKWEPDSIPRALVFLLHGLSDHGERFTHLGEALSDAGFLFFAPDLRGNGKSVGKRGHFHNLEEVNGDIDFLFQEMLRLHKGIPVFIYGQSMGGNLAMEYSMRRKPAISGVIASSPWIRLAHPPSAITRMLGKGIEKIMPSLSMSNGIRPGDLTHNAEISEKYRIDPLIHGRITLRTFSTITDSGEWILKSPGELTMPLLLLHGDADRITSFGASQTFFERSKNLTTFEAFPGLFHELHNEFDKMAVIRRMTDWIKEILDRTPKES